MKRVGGILRLVMAAVIAVPLFGLAWATAGPGVAEAACSPDFQVQGCAANPPSANNVNLSQNYVCIAIPVFPGEGQGHCPSGQIQINNDPGSGGAAVAYLKLILRLINGAIGAIIIMMIVISGIQYITSTADPARVKAAKTRLQNAILALVLYMIMYAAIRFLVPGNIL